MWGSRVLALGDAATLGLTWDLAGLTWIGLQGVPGTFTVLTAFSLSLVRSCRRELVFLVPPLALPL